MRLHPEGGYHRNTAAAQLSGQYYEANSASYKTPRRVAVTTVVNPTPYRSGQRIVNNGQVGAIVLDRYKLGV